MSSRNSIRLYPPPRIYKDSFIYGGRRYFITSSMCLISQYGRYGFCPPIDRGLYESFPVGDYKKIKALYDLERKRYSDSLNGNLNEGVKKQSTFSF